MSPRSNKMLRSGLGTARRLITSSSIVTSLLYDERNQHDFYDLDSHEEMLADQIRVDAYQKAIEATVGPGDVVIDLGTGTGLLAMLAAKQGATVHAIEHSPIVEVAELVAAHNDLDIHFHRLNSREFTAPEPADIILHEQIGNVLFEENMIGNILDLKRRALKPDGRILPARFEFYLEPIELAGYYQMPFAWERPVAGIDYSVVKDRSELPRRSDRLLRVDTGSLARYACDPTPMLTLDLDEMTDESDTPSQVTATRQVVSPGPIDALSVFFRAFLGDEEPIDNALDSPHTNWQHYVYRIPRRQVADGQELVLEIDFGHLVDPRTWAVTADGEPVAGSTGDTRPAD